MKQLIITLITGLILCCSGIAQNYIVDYTYDASGNRIKREITIVIPKSAQIINENEEVQIEEAWGERKVVIYPNPTKGNLYVSITGGDDASDYNYKVYDTSGVQVLNGNIYHLGEHPILFEKYSPGIYILILQCRNESKTYKIIKQ